MGDDPIMDVLMEQPRYDGGSAVRVNDPSDLTTRQLHREITVLRELIDSMVAGMDRTANQRFDAIEKQFELMEKQRLEQKADTQAAVQSALAAQKEAVREQTIASERAIAKSDAATAKQIEQLAANFATSLTSVAVQQNDSKERIVKIESMKQGGDSTVSKTFAIIAAVGSVFAIVVAIIAIATMGK